MASTREERMQQRLRGSQRRQVKDVDFGLTFAPAPALVQPIPSLQPSTRRSPRRSLELAPPPPTHPTPSSRARSQPPSVTPGDENIRSTTSHSTVDANTSAKRRKLNTDDPSTSTRSTRSSLRTPRLNIYDLNEEEPMMATADVTNESIEQSTEIRQIQEQDASTLFVSHTAVTPPPVTVEEVIESPSHAPGSGHRTRIINRSTKQSSRLQDELQADGSSQIEPVRSPTPRKKRKSGEASEEIPDTGRSRRTRRSKMNSATNEIDDLSPDQPKRGRRRRSSIHRESLEEPIDEESARERETAEEIQDAEAAVILNRSRRISRRDPAEPSPDLDEPSEQLRSVAKKQRSRPRPISSPAQQRRPKNANSKAASKPSKQAARNQNRMTSPIPITVHRLTKGPIYDEDESDADILNSDIPFARRGGVNVIDTLNQVCVEVIQSALETLQDNSRNTHDPALKREYGHKYRVVESFGRELSTRLLDHTINLDNTSSLEKRLRQEQKKRLALREEISRVKAERHQVALRMDEIRIKHEMDSGAAQDQNTLNTMVHDIELAVERSRQNDPHDPANRLIEMVGTEVLLKRIAGEVSNKSDSGGMLKQIKDFNAFLERTAVALETRKT